MPIKPKSIVVRDLKVSYLDNGIEAENSLIFIHGFPFAKEMWKQQLEALDRSVHGIAYDIRGFGASDAGHGFFSIELFASDLLYFIEELKLKNVILCGLSMGGYIALRAFERSPERFSGLILCDTNAFADKNESRLNRFAVIEKIQQGGKIEFAENNLRQLLCEETFAEAPAVTAFVREMIENTSERTICAAQLAMASRTDTTAVLKEIQVPVLIVRGEHDRLMPIEQAELLKSEIKYSTLAEIPQSGHLPNLEKPEAFNAQLNDFLKKFV